MALSRLTPARLRGREHDQDRVRETFLRMAILRGLSRRRAEWVADDMTHYWRSGRRGAGEHARNFLLTGHRGRGARTFSGDSHTPPPPPPPPEGDVVYGEGLPAGYIPSAPLVRVDVTPQVWSGTTYFVPSGNTTALFAAYASYNPAAGDRIILEAGGVWTFSSNTIIGAKSFADFQMAVMEPEDWSDIAAALALDADGMPAGMPRVHGDPWTGPNTRMTEAQAVALGIPRIVCTGLGSSLAFGPNSGGLYVRGIWFDNVNTTGQCSGVVNISHYRQINGYDSPDDMSTDVVLNQVMVGHFGSEHIQKGVRFCGARLAMVNSTAYGFTKFFPDGNAWWGAGGRGPWKVTNDCLMGSGENGFIGGNTLEHYHRDVIPSDIEMNYNWYHRPSRYIYSHPDYIPPLPAAGSFDRWITKNTLESKYGKRWENVGCVHDGCCTNPGGQGGQWFSPKCSAQGAGSVSGDPTEFDWCETSDVVFWLNKAINVGGGIILYRDQPVGGNPGKGTKRMLVENNLSILGSAAAYTGGRDGLQFAGGPGTGTDPDNWSVRRNSFVGVEGTIDKHIYFLAEYDQNAPLIIEDNIFLPGSSGISGDRGTSEGLGTINQDMGAAAVLRGNVFASRDPSKYAGYNVLNYFPADVAAMGIDPTTGVLTPGGPLAAGGIYQAFGGGRDNGADVALINTVTSGVMTAEL